VEDPKRSLLLVFPALTGLMEQVCICAEVLLWKWLGKHCHMAYNYSPIPPFWELSVEEWCLLGCYAM
jgi:hypothetical protein